MHTLQFTLSFADGGMLLSDKKLPDSWILAQLKVSTPVLNEVATYGFSRRLPKFCYAKFNSAIEKR